MKKLIFSVAAFFLLFTALSQTRILKGRITDSHGEPMAGVSVILKETNIGAVSNEKGNFSLSSGRAFPFKVVFTSMGFNPLELEVVNDDFIEASLSARFFELDLTLAATRVPVKIISAPVSIERLSQRDLVTTPAATPYDALAYLKGVDFVTSSLTFKTPSTRGFNGSGSTRVNQWVDGMDNQAPGMNFSVGNFAGVIDQDIESIEVLQGASSALFGPGGMCGTILINSKNPFASQGLSIYVKEGIMNIDKSRRPNVTVYHDWSLRYARVIGNKFAFKVAVQYLRATDWLANDSANYSRSLQKVIKGTRNSDPNYDGVNVYGDETSVNIQPYIPAAYQAFFPPEIYVSRTGYNEKDLIDPETKNLKLSGAIHYKINHSTEAILVANYGTGNTVYTGSDRYALKDIKIGQYKLEVRNPKWFIRGYTTQENAGRSYATTTLTRYLNEVWKPSENWYGAYVNTFVGAALTGSDPATAHSLARAEADKGRPLPGSDQFNKIFDQLAAIPISKGGGLFIDHTNLYMAEAQYNLGKAVPFADVLVGGNYKRYVLNSEGTIFIDTAGAIGINEYGGYIQATRKMFKNHLTLAASGRADKNQNFAAKFTPRFSAVIQVAGNNNIRISYQTAYRFPSTQQQFIKLQVGSREFLLGGLPWIQNYIQSKNETIFQVTDNAIIPYQFTEFKPETSKSFEVGYRGLINKKLLIDAYTYFSSFTNFLGRVTLLQASSGNYYSIATNSSTVVKTNGIGLGLQYFITKELAASFNSYYDKITNVPTGFVASYNTPKYRVNTGLSGSGLGKQKKLGFGIQYKWQDSFLFENDFATGTIDAWSTVDAQVNYKIYKNECELKLGATNLLNHYYKNGFGNPEIGGLYYAALKFDIK